MTMNPREEFVSVQEAANIMGLDRSRVGRLCREGRFPGAAKVGSSWIIPREAVLNHKPLPPGVKPRSERVKAERAALREEVAAAVSAAKGEEG
ncbi:helix-turn-helix domain-containing protein [uncultured Fretibacterium sp.]|uniref:helix-turn-helix domain-containing protein n=1 Tax=uncultured Fretibacterium sp. TaxID=1678694 RepID=UPI00325F9981